MNIVLSGPNEAAVSREAAKAANWVVALAERHAIPVLVLGPAPCPIEKVKDRFRWHFLIKGPAEALGRVVRYAATRLDASREVRLAIDRDPVSLL